MSEDSHVRVHATLVGLPREDDSLTGTLLCGEPGAGKSSMAFRLIDSGGILVADDQVDLTFGHGGLWGAPPDNIAGLIEARGIGLIRLPYEPRMRITCVVTLKPGFAAERMPVREWYQPPETFRARSSALRIPAFTLDPLDPAVPAKIAALTFGRLHD